MSEGVEEVGVFWGWKVLIVVLFITFKYINFLRQKRPAVFGRLCTPIGWNFGFKKLVSYIQIEIYQKWLPRKRDDESSIFLPSEDSIRLEQRKSIDGFTACDMQRLQCLDTSGNNLVLGMIFYENKRECVVTLRLADGTLYEPDSPNTVVESSGGNDWSVRGLRFDTTEAKKRLRIQFNGLMKKSSPDNSATSLHYVQLKFVWNAEGDWIDVRKDWHSSLKSDAIAREIWKENDWKYLIKDQGRGYDQWGVARGLVTVDEKEPLDLNLVSLRQRRWGRAEADTLLCRAGLIGLTETGLAFYIRASCSPIGLTYARFGHARFPDGTTASVSDCEILVDEVPTQPSTIPNNMSFSLTAKGNFMDGFMTKLHFWPIEGHQFSSRLVSVQLGLNGERGFGIAELWYRKDYVPLDPLLVASPKTGPEVPKDLPLAVAFGSKHARNALLTGGKGSSLSQLATNCSSMYSVPAGFCLTVAALEKHLEVNPLIKDNLLTLKGLSGEKLAKQCNDFAELMKTVPLCSSVLKEMKNQIDKIRYPVAVRSSAVGEDGESTSSAGQNSTFLGLHTFDAVANAVLNCWTSLYSFTSVQYRIEHGMGVLCEMAVVIQEMVDAEKAGVLFTAHPITLDPRRTLISANYGIGETVVSSAVDPDTIELAKDSSNNFEIISEVPGHKDHKIILTEDGTSEVSLTDKEALELCLTKEESLNLASVGSVLTEIYGKPLDLEWAISGGRLYLLQARPITSQSAWTDFELLHEFDTPIFSNLELSSIANTGEVLPGASSTLCVTTTGAILSSKPQITCSISHHRCLLDLYRTTLSVLPKSIDFSVRITDLAIMGHEATTPEVFAIALRRKGPTGTVDKIKNIGGSIKSMWSSKALVKRAEDLHRNAEMSGSGSSIEEVFEIIKQKFKILETILNECHYSTSRASTTSQVILFLILSGGKDFSSENVSDIGTILSSCSKSVSSGIPLALERLATLISATVDASEFVDLSPLKAIEFLKEKNQTASELWDVFLKKFGHRGWREFDVMTSVWALEPSPVITSLQELVRKKLNVSETDSQIREPERDEGAKSIDDILASLKTPLSTIQRYFLRKVIGLAYSAVNYREKTKEAIIGTIHQLRLSYLHLARLLVEQNRLPRPSLIYHLSFSELRDLVVGNSIGPLLIKASQRQRLWKTWDDLQFPHTMIGLPSPIQVKKAVTSWSEDERTVLMGTLVYPGCVIGRALVARNVKDAKDAQPGDILIAHSTDVGWSPFFPLLGGVVTELGGLISHGAVVAREYGLPCIVGVQEATSTFSTGDMVMLNASAGVIEKISSSD